LDETKGFIDLLWRLSNFKFRVGIQLNVSCPNTEHKTLMMIKEALGFLSCFQKIRKTGVPIDLKIGVADASLDFIKEIEASGLADCITCSNTIKYGGMPEKINWEEFFGQKGSPLKKYGGGGLSGRPLLPIVIDWLKMVRDAGITMPIKGGGGILSLEDAKEVIGAGANAIEIGAVTILRPWRVESIINGVNKLQGKEL
jgi:dihydroorotate dehydrogenase (NAD+) catalytic subunit